MKRTKARPRLRLVPPRAPASPLREWFVKEGSPPPFGTSQLLLPLRVSTSGDTVAVDDRPTVVDLFSGAGGFTRGFASLGYRSVWANDFDPACTATYARNFGSHCHPGDINAILDSDVPLPRADVVIGGPPCQGFSLLNKKRKRDPRKALWKAYMEVVRRVSPSVFVMENVPELIASEEFEEIRRSAEAMGYGGEGRLVFGVLNTADYGVPQRRRRAIIIASREGKVSLPPATHCDAKSARGRGLLPWVTVREAIGDLPAARGIEPRVGIVPPPIDLHFGRSPTEKSLERYRAVPPGGNRFDLQRNRPDLTPACWIRKTEGGTDLFGRLWWDRPSVTIRTEFFKPEKGRYLHPVKHRPITHREAARIQTFPDDFLFLGTKVEIARQIGNAVPCVFASQIAASVAEHLREVGVLRSGRSTVATA